MSFADLMIWTMPEISSECARKKGIPDMFLSFLDHAERTRNVEYFERIAARLLGGEDPFSTLAAEAQAILQRQGAA